MSHTDWKTLIKDYRVRNALTQATLAEMLGVDPTTVSRWERGRDKPELGVQRRLRDMMYRGDDGAERALVRLIDECGSDSVLIDDQWRIVRTSPAHQRTRCYSPSDLYGTDFRHVMSESTREVISAAGLSLSDLDKHAHEITLHVERQPFEKPFRNPIRLRQKSTTTFVRTGRPNPLRVIVATRVPHDEPFAVGLVQTLFDPLVG
jgi:DNA-binding XRE family transcriptional regulator